MPQIHSKQFWLCSRIIIIIIFLTVSFLSNAQTTISGKVVEKGSKEPLPFANVRIKGTSTGVATNIDGFFSLINIDPNVTLEISFVGYDLVEVKLTGQDFLEIELKPLTNELAEVVVAATSYKVFDATTGTSATTLSTKQINLLPSIGEPDIFRALQMLPGVSSTSESSSGLFIRGGTPDQNLTLLDGMTVYKVDHFFGFFSAFNTNAVKDVRLFRGAFPARYGGRTSGVVELTGKTGSFDKIQGGFNASLVSVGGYFEMPITNKLSIFVAGRRSYSEIIKGGLYKDLIGNLSNEDNFDGTLLENATNITTEPDFYFYDWNSKISYKPSSRDMITFSTYNGKDYLNESQNLNDDIAEGINLNYALKEQTDWGNRGASTKWSRQWTSRIYTNLLFAGSEYFSNYDRDEDVLVLDLDSVRLSRNRRTFEENSVIDLSVKANLEWQINNNTKAEFGIAFTDNQIEYDNIRDDTVVLLSRSQRASYSSVFASQEGALGSKMKYTLGIRASKYENEDDLLIEPRVNLSYALNSRIKLKSAYGIHYQFVNQIVNQNISEGSREFWLLADNDPIELSSATHYVLGASYELDNWLFDVESYYKSLDGITEFSLQFRRGVDDSVSELFRSGDGVAKGVEFLIQKKKGLYTGWISYTLSDLTNTFPDLNEGFAFRPLHYQRHEFKMVNSLELEDGWTVASNFIYGSGKPFSEPNNRYEIELLDGRTLQYIGLGPRNNSFNPAYIRLDVSANKQFKIGKTSAQLGLSLFNLLGRENIWYTEYDFGQSPPLVNQVTYLGFTPNLLFSIKF
ncbi:MAG: TonB-dependent receptor [bacterium]|nr:TonB-dependent receptor [bacterium]